MYLKLSHVFARTTYRDLPTCTYQGDERFQHPRANRDAHRAAATLCSFVCVHWCIGVRIGGERRCGTNGVERRAWSIACACANVRASREPYTISHATCAVDCARMPYYMAVEYDV